MQFEYRSRSFDIEGVSQGDHIFKAIVRSGSFHYVCAFSIVANLTPFSVKWQSILAVSAAFTTRDSTIISKLQR